MKDKLEILLEKIESSIKKEDLSSVVILADDKKLTFALVVPDSSCVKLKGENIVDFSLHDKTVNEVYNEYLRFRSLQESCRAMAETTAKITEMLEDILDEQADADTQQEKEPEQNDMFQKTGTVTRYDN